MDKNIQTYEQSYFASCSAGLEPILSKELQAMSAKKVTVSRGGAEFKGDIPAIKAVLNSRTASRILRKLCSFEVLDEKGIYQAASTIPWNRVFNPHLTFKVQTIISNQVFKNSIYTSQLLKDAIVDHFRKTSGQRPNVNINEPDVMFVLRGESTNRGPIKVSIYVDLCGNPLHERGYRVSQVAAPLKENMAAGILLISEWGPDGKVLIDTMCGSGTFLIEGALIKYDIPPCFMHLRSKKTWAFQKLNFFAEHKELPFAFDTEVQDCRRRVTNGMTAIKTSEPCIFGMDIDEKAVRAAKENLNMAGLADKIRVEQVDALRSSPPVKDPDGKAIAICNPPYGERIGDIKKLDEMYYLYGENLKNNFKGYSAVIFTGNLDSAKHISLKPLYKTPLFNGRIECRVLRYPLY